MTVRHRRPNIEFDATGIAIRPRFLSSFLLPWDNIDFVSPTPRYERFEEDWRPVQTPDYLRVEGSEDAGDYLVRKGILELKISVRDRHQLPGWTSRLLGNVFCKAMFDADDKPMSHQGVMTLELRTPRLSPDVGALFDVIDRNSRFDLICTF